MTSNNTNKFISLDNLKQYHEFAQSNFVSNVTLDDCTNSIIKQTTEKVESERDVIINHLNELNETLNTESNNIKAHMDITNIHMDEFKDHVDSIDDQLTSVWTLQREMYIQLELLLKQMHYYCIGSLCISFIALLIVLLSLIY